MAKNKCIVYLGYDDEAVGEKNKPYVDFTTNKIGGNADWPCPGIIVKPCPTCGQNRPLIVQIYAPLDNSQFHRTLFVFACLNAPCSNQSQSWLCIRTETLDKIIESNDGAMKTQNIKSNINWCSGADEWGDDENMAENDENENEEENGNIMQPSNRISDDDESNSTEQDSMPNFVNMSIHDEKNANCQQAQLDECSAQLDECSALGSQNVPTMNATAEIEGGETEVIAIDSPLAPKRDLIALMNQPQIVSRDVVNMTLKSFFIAVDEEYSNDSNVSDHVIELLQDYQRRDEVKTSPESPGATGGVEFGEQDLEVYEKSIPIHGDLMFHNFMTRIQENPGQILRYSRTASPLLIAPLKESIPRCHNCGSEMICEIQILPTIIPKLRLENNDPIPIDFGNVLVFTCMKSCWDTPDKMRTEAVLVQKEI